MRPSDICVWLLCLIGRAVADKNATPFQMVYLWYAYLMDVEVGGHVIAPGCSNCDLDSFLKYIEAPPGKAGPWTGTTNLNGPWTGDLAPTVQNIADAIKQSGYKGLTDGNKIIPSKINPGVTTTFGMVYKPVQDHVQLLRANVEPDDNRVSRMIAAMWETLFLRIDAMKNNAITTINDMSDSKGWGIQAVPSGSDTNFLDSQATLATNPAHSADCKAFVQGYSSGIPQQGLNSKMNGYIKGTIGHATAITNVHYILSELNTPVFCVKGENAKTRRRWTAKRLSLKSV